MSLKEKNTPSVVVLDGPAGAGKSSVARAVAKRLRLPFLDTGAIYRAIALTMLRDSIPAQDSPALMRKLETFEISFEDGEVFSGGENITRALRSPEIDRVVSGYAALASVRASLLDIQRRQARQGLVAEGRDMGTVVFPDADLKIFLTASAEARAKRRYEERLAKGETAQYEEILEQVNERDRLDSTRDVAPLKQAEDAIYLDTTECTFEQVVDRVLAYAAAL